MMNDEDQDFYGEVVHTGGRFRGTVTLFDVGALVVGVASPPDHEVIGLPERTVFFPYTAVHRVEVYPAYPHGGSE